jgi:DNA-binding CsgD family transcriptional regulator
VDGNLNDAQYFALIHPDYLEDYLNWSSAIYRFVYQYKDLLAPFRQCFALTFPMRLKGGRFYWVHMEVVLLQLDAANRVYSHFNSYTIGQPFDGSQGILPLHGEIWEDGTMHAEWSLELRKIRFTRQPFLLCQAQRRIVDAMRADARATNKAIATQLGKSPHTINNQKKEILRKARQSFPDYTLGDTRDLLVLLEHLRYFDDYADFE